MPRTAAATAAIGAGAAEALIPRLPPVVVRSLVLSPDGCMLYALCDERVGDSAGSGGAAAWPEPSPATERSSVHQRILPLNSQSETDLHSHRHTPSPLSSTPSGTSTGNCTAATGSSRVIPLLRMWEVGSGKHRTIQLLEHDWHGVKRTANGGGVIAEDLLVVWARVGESEPRPVIREKVRVGWANT